MKPMDESQLRFGQFHFLVTRSPNLVFVSVLIAIVGGIASSLLIPLLLTSIAPAPPLLADFVERDPFYLWHYEVAQPRFALAFLLLCVAVVVTRAVSQTLFSSVLLDAARALRLFFAERLRRLPIAKLEQIGPTRVVTAINVDIASLIDGAANVPVLLINGSMIVGALTYIAFLHDELFWLVLGVILLGVTSYRLPLMLGSRYFVRARPLRDAIQGSIEAQVYGAKELRLNAARYEEFMQTGMRLDEQRLARLLGKGFGIIHMAIQYGNVIGFLAIGAVAYIAAARYEVTPEMLFSIVMAMLFIMGPIGVIVNVVPSMLQGTVALRHLRALLDDMPVENMPEGGPVLPCQKITLEQLAYTYGTQDGFSIGPISLTLKAGQVTFIIGGNGSGKSTLAKIISCHYVPSSGRMLFNDTPVTPANLYCARQGISAIYLDFYLFERLYGMAPEVLARVPAYLELLGLSHKVSLDADRFSTVSLSAGQRKRLALLVALLEDRQLYVFDEWAADQDPEFKHEFYTNLLGELRQRGKIVVVISHDDRYFPQADQLVWMEHGKLLRVEHPAPARSPALLSAEDCA